MAHCALIQTGNPSPLHMLFEDRIPENRNSAQKPPQTGRPEYPSVHSLFLMDLENTYRSKVGQLQCDWRRLLCGHMIPTILMHWRERAAHERWSSFSCHKGKTVDSKLAGDSTCNRPQPKVRPASGLLPTGLAVFSSALLTLHPSTDRICCLEPGSP